MKTWITTLFALVASVGFVKALPDDLVSTRFAGPDIVPSPACLCASPYGEVFVGVDMNGSLGKGAGKGKIIKLIDTDQDGVADKHTVFADIDNPRGLISVGDSIWVLHTVIPAETDVMTGMHLSRLDDKDRDGVADGPAQILVKNISTLKHNQDRGADHTTNGIRMGIDGWIYIAVGDFGFVDAIGADGKKLTLLGGGVLRVRPDGTEMEMYTRGLRNIYDVAIDPFMNIFTRGNTNDGGGWNVRFIHHIQTGNYGYPMLFKYFTGEILPALADVGGGSGTGAMFLQEPTWPDKYNNVPLMADWGRSQLYIHRVTPDGASFTQAHEEFIKCSQIADVDIDTAGQMFLAAWDGAGYKGNPEKGYVERIVPKGWQYSAFPDLKKASPDELAEILRSESSTARLYAQQEILARADKNTGPAVLAVAKDEKALREARVAAIFTYAQLLESGAAKELATLVSDPQVREFALRAMADRKDWAKNLPISAFIASLYDDDPRVKVAAAVALGRIGNPEAVAGLLKVSEPPAQQASTPQTTAYWSSEIIKGKTVVDIDVDISAYKELFLIVDDAGSNGNDHAAWINPVITQTDGTEIDLTKTKWKSAKGGWGKTLVGKDCMGKPIKGLDGNSYPNAIGTHAKSVIAFKITNKRTVNRFKAQAVLTSGSVGKGAVKFIVSPTPTVGVPEGNHATPNSDIILSHVGVDALVQLQADDVCLAAVSDSDSEDAALWALHRMPSVAVVEGLIAQAKSCEDKELQAKIITTLARLYHKEAAYDGSWWWGTRPDTRGPYYVPETWEASEKIAAYLRDYRGAASAAEVKWLTDLADKHRLNLEGIGGVEVLSEADKKKGEVGRTSIEDIVLSLDKLKGNRKNGQKVLSKMACIGCHNVAPGQPIKGPDLTLLGDMTLADLAESIIKPEASIAKSWINVTKKDSTQLPGTLVKEDAKELVIHNIAGIPTTVAKADIANIAPGPPLMGPHLADDLSLQEFADMLTYIKTMGQK
ncbi:MAG: NPCBM/NEW2 domain-containing protein [Verrucomicrobiota bacterium]